MEWIVQLPLLFFSVIVHEFSHGWVAFAKGDDTAERQGRLTLNPVSHIDPLGTVFFPLLCLFLQFPMFGWAKPVPVDPRLMGRPRRDAMQVAFAGPAANLLLALALALTFRLAAAAPIFTPEFRETILDALQFGVSINLFLAFFNLLPVHPLDGSRVLDGLLPAPWRARYARMAPYGLYVIVALMATHLLNPIVIAPAKAVWNLFAKLGLIW